MDRNYKERPGQKARPVALRKESVDRNSEINTRGSKKTKVALRKESVDRNSPAMNTISYTTVALRKESVDRNYDTTALMKCQVKSLSARRAWIEIYKYSIPYKYILSLSARRAWIEMKSGLRPLIASVSRSPQGERG